MRQVKLFLLLICCTLEFTAQIPQEGLIEIFDGLDLPAGVVVGDVTVAEDRFGTECAIEFGGELTDLILVQGWEPYNISPDSSMSISLWYQGGSNDAGDLESLIIKYGQGPDPHFNPLYGLQLYDLNTPLMSSPNFSVWADQSVIVFPDDPEWHHLVGVFEVGAWKLYLDNELRGENDFGLPTVGQASSDLAFGPGFEGKMDDIIMYDRALTAQEVDQLFNASSLCAVGLTEFRNDLDVLIYPNPARDMLTLDLGGIVCDFVEVRDERGLLVKELVLSADKSTTDISELADGQYFMLLFQQGEFIGSSRFSKN